MLLYLTFKKISEYSENWNIVWQGGATAWHIHGWTFICCFVSYLNLTMELTLAESWRWLLIFHAKKNIYYILCIIYSSNMLKVLFS